ncbi:hypothetical protein GF340_02315 [Candidatus Peregrinibacteria bacterium]|nr:hypothetical protein [Candidatus Peregrinibacteria bacterium]
MKNSFIKKLLIFTIAFGIYFLTAATYIHALSIFLDDLGAEYLPLVFATVSIFIIGTTVVNAYFSTKHAAYKIFAGLIIFFIANFLVLSFMKSGTVAHTFYFLLIANLLFFLQELMVLHFAGSVLTTLQAKRNLPIIFGLMNTGVIAGALLAEPFSEIHESVGIGLIPIAVLIVVLSLILLSSQVFKKEIALNQAENEKGNFFPTVKKGLHFLKKETHLFQWLAVVVAVFVGMQLLIEFKLKSVLEQSFHQNQLTVVLGYVYALKSAIIWILSMFVFKKVLFRFGISNMLIFFPISVLVTLIASVLMGLNYVAAILLFTVFAVSYYGYYGITISQMFSIVPQKVHESVYFLIKGLLYALSLLLFSLVLVIFTFFIELEPVLNTAIIGLLCLIAIYAATKVKLHYFKEIKADLYRRDDYLKARAIDLLAEKISKKQGEIHLRRMLKMPNTSRNIKSRILTSLGIIGDYNALVDLTGMLETDEKPRTKVEIIHTINEILGNGKRLKKYPVTKHYLLKALEQLLLSDEPNFVKSEAIGILKYFDLEDVIQFLEDHLKSKSVHIKANTIKTLSSFKDRGIIPYLVPFLSAKDPDLVSEAIVGLWQFDEERIKLLPRVAYLLHGDDKKFIRSALYVIGSVKADWEIEYVRKKLKSKNEHIKIYALITLILLGETEQIDPLLQKMLKLAKKGQKRELEFVLSWYKRFDENIKKALLSKIQQLNENDAKYFYDAFMESKFVFNMETDALNVAIKPTLQHA